MIGVPTGTVCPGSTSSAATVPANGDGSSTTDLADSTSTSTSLTATASPGRPARHDRGLGQALPHVGQPEL